jgi:NADPH:quinone reductase-like Zn-dependent oxidoreductase
MIEAGEIAPVVGHTYSLSEAREAMACVGSGHARGKVVISV